MLVSAKEMLDKAKAGHYAVGHFNINNLEWTKSILAGADIYITYYAKELAKCIDKGIIG